MPPKKHRKQPRHQQLEQSDYDSENLTTDYGGTHALSHVSHVPPIRTNEELNLTVLRRHNPDIQQIISVAPFAVVYYFSGESQTWEKSGIEGTLFICQLVPEVIGYGEDGLAVERFGVVILNRKGLNNFVTDLKSSNDVEITDEYVILQIDNGADGEEHGIFGLWIFSEKDSSTENSRVINAQVIMECALRSEKSRQAVEEAGNRGADGDGSDEGFEQAYEDGSHFAGQHQDDHGFYGAPQQAIPQSQPHTGQPVDLLSLFGKTAQPPATNGHSNGHNAPLPSDGLQQHNLQSTPHPGHFSHAHPNPMPQQTQAQSLLNLFKR